MCTRESTTPRVRLGTMAATRNADVKMCLQAFTLVMIGEPNALNFQLTISVQNRYL